MTLLLSGEKLRLILRFDKEMPRLLLFVVAARVGGGTAQTAAGKHCSRARHEEYSV